MTSEKKPGRKGRGTSESAEAEAPDTESGGERTAPAFEDSVKRLSEIVDRLEKGDLPLEQSLGLFEEGVQLARSAQTRLDAAERRVEELLAIDENGKPLTRELETE